MHHGSGSRQQIPDKAAAAVGWVSQARSLTLQPPSISALCISRQGERQVTDHTRAAGVRNESKAAMIDPGDAAQKSFLPLIEPPLTVTRAMPRRQWRRLAQIPPVPEDSRLHRVASLRHVDAKERVPLIVRLQAVGGIVEMLMQHVRQGVQAILWMRDERCTGACTCWSTPWHAPARC